MDLQHLFVIPQMREQGVGRALIAHAAEHARLHRCAGLTLGVMAQNTPAQAFYRALGFEVRETSGVLFKWCAPCPCGADKSHPKVASNERISEIHDDL